MFFSSETSVTEKSTHLPEGEICGSETRFIAMRSAKVMGRFVVDAAGCWAASGAIARAAARREVARRIGRKCSAAHEPKAYRRGDPSLKARAAWKQRQQQRQQQIPCGGDRKKGKGKSNSLDAKNAKKAER